MTVSILDLNDNWFTLCPWTLNPGPANIKFRLSRHKRLRLEARDGELGRIMAKDIVIDTWSAESNMTKIDSE